MFYAVYDAVVSMAADAIAIAVLSVVLIIIVVGYAVVNAVFPVSEVIAAAVKAIAVVSVVLIIIAVVDAHCCVDVQAVIAADVDRTVVVTDVDTKVVAFVAFIAPIIAIDVVLPVSVMVVDANC